MAHAAMWLSPRIRSTTIINPKIIGLLYRDTPKLDPKFTETAMSVVQSFAPPSPKQPPVLPLRLMHETLHDAQMEFIGVAEGCLIAGTELERVEMKANSSVHNRRVNLCCTSGL